ncbi:uncharacterized protein LOC128881955 [Hylaeus volcanicus]|uniref:uncharacterized protein LOC128881955 n=1 Tax=Hylaeus volcanicus TaxID=313075 RepID=UPI0023B78489|nr:uncharacterized protein LOC128881955 [Hylaeus volcanicus]
MRAIVCTVLILGLNLALCVQFGAAHDCSKVVIEPVVGDFEHSEGPHWDHHSQKLYFVDITAQKICKFSPATKDLACIYIENGPVGVAVPVEGEPNKLVCGTGTDFVLVSWDGERNVSRSSPETLAIVDTDRNGTRWNDGKVDSSGRFWGGTIGPEVNAVVVPNQATFYRIDSDLNPKKELSPVTNSNGLAWNLQDDTLYYIDTPTRQVAAFDFEPIEGVISNKRIAFDLEKNNVTGLPDGMTIDRDGNLWVALFNGGGVANVNPHTGHVLRIIKLPVIAVTSCAFGGPSLDILYVTTSKRDLTPKEQAEQPYAGYVFAVHGLGVHGLIANSFRLKMAEVTVEPLIGPYNLGEGPHWDPASQNLYFVDIFAQKVFRYNPSTKALTSTYVEHGPVGFVLPVDGASDKLVVGSRTEILMLTWDGKKDSSKCESRKLATTGTNPKEIRWNDGKADASGRIWGGTMGYETNGVFPHNVGALYCVHNDLAVKTHLPSVSISNGIAWTPNEDTFYYIDSLTYQVEAYDYNPQTATISNRRTVFDLKKHNMPGIPDGMTIDTNGNLWVALFGGGGVMQIKPETGELLRFIKINNVDNITSVAFGGADLDTLYVTTATTGLTEKQLKEQPHAGYLFAIKGLGARGFPANSFKLANK